MASPFDSSFTLQAMVMVKLTSSNYLLWHSQVHPILFSQKFLCFVDGSAPALPKTVFNMTKFPTTNSEYTKWYSDDQIVRVFLSFTLNEEALSAIINCTISREILDSFVVAFNCPSKVCDLRLKDELQFIKKGNHSIFEFCSAFKSLCDQLASMGLQVDETDKSHWFYVDWTLIFMCSPLPKLTWILYLLFPSYCHWPSLMVVANIIILAVVVARRCISGGHGSAPGRGGRAPGGDHGHGWYNPTCQIFRQSSHCTTYCPQ
ncbi:hypothetical protein ACS0TY_006712 [Phlomoides rotata]